MSKIAKRNVLLMLIIEKFLGTFYECYWYIKEKDNLDKQLQKNKIFSLIAITFITIITGITLDILSFLEFDIANELIAGLYILLLAYIIILISLRFEVKKYVEKRIKTIELHPAGVLFFGPYYIQSKINQVYDKNTPWWNRILPSMLVLIGAQLAIGLLIIIPILVLFSALSFAL